MARAMCFASVAVFAGCSGADGSDDLSLGGWLGPTPHFRAAGRLDGELVELESATELTCALEWQVPGGLDAPDHDSGQMSEVRIDGVVGARSFELELKRHDFQSDAIGAEIAIVPRDDAHEPAPDEAWVEWEWHSTDGEDLYEQAAASGQIVLERLTGELDATGLVLVPGSGEAGAWIEARWSPTEALKISFTAPCTDSFVEFVE